MNLMTEFDVDNENKNKMFEIFRQIHKISIC